MKKPLIIDCHGHYTTAPKALENWRNAQVANLNTPELGPRVSDLKISDDELRESIETNQLRLMKERGSDITLFSPRASFMAHHIGDFNVSSTWAAICNELCYRVSQLFPDHFVPVAMLGVGPSVIAVPANAPWKNIRELIEDSKRRPGQVVFGSAGMGSFQHFAIEWFMQKTGARFNVVHYKGGVPALIDLAAGHIQVSLGSLIQMQNFLKAGKIRLLAVSGPKRVAQIGQVPTLHESGYSLEVHNWWGLLAPPARLTTRPWPANCALFGKPLPTRVCRSFNTNVVLPLTVRPRLAVSGKRFV